MSRIANHKTTGFVEDTGDHLGNPSLRDKFLDATPEAEAILFYFFFFKGQKEIVNLIKKKKSQETGQGNVKEAQQPKERWPNASPQTASPLHSCPRHEQGWCEG